MNLAAMDLNLGAALDALLRQQSVSAAAETVGRMQSAISHSLARLRDHFRDPLLVRDGWAMRLTPLGEDLRPRAAASAEASRRLFAAGSDFDPATTARRIRIAAPDLCASLFTRLIRDLSAEAPSASIEFAESGMPRQAVLRSEPDIGLGFGRPKSDPNLAMDEIAPLGWCTFAPLAHDYARSGAEADRRSSRHVVVGQGGGQEGPIEKRLRQLGLTRHVLCYASNFSAALTMAVATNALFTTLRAPFEETAERLGMTARPVPFEMPEAPATLMFRSDYGDPFSIWLRERCLRALSR